MPRSFVAEVTVIGSNEREGLSVCNVEVNLITLVRTDIALNRCIALNLNGCAVKEVVGVVVTRTASTL